MLAWAREEAGLTSEELAAALKVDPREVAAWETGDAYPARGVFTKTTEILRRPSALFFLPEPPLKAGLPTSLRSAPGLAGHRLSRDEVRQIRWARRLQEITSWVLADSNEPLSNLPHYDLATSVGLAASALRTIIEVPVEEQLQWRSANQAFREWRIALERLGILTFQLQLGRGNIRGFSAWDERAPLIGVNSAYHPTARIFTLFHELGHLITRTDSACLRFIIPNVSEHRAERWCERFAAELLLPSQVVKEISSAYGVTSRSKADDLQAVRKISGRFKVSTRAATLRLQELELATPDLYQRIEIEMGELDWNPKAEGGGGQPAPEKRVTQLGARVPEVLIEATNAGRITRSDLSDYLRLTIGQVDDLRSLVG